MVRIGPPDDLFDGLNLKIRVDRITALTRLCDALVKAEKMLIESSNDAESEPPSSKQCACSWYAMATISAGVRAVAKVMIAEQKA